MRSQGPWQWQRQRVGSRQRLRPSPADVGGPYCHEGWVEIPGVSSFVGDTVLTRRNELNKQVKKGWDPKSANALLWSEVQAGAGTRLYLITPLWLQARRGWHWGHPSWKCVALGPVHMCFGHLLPPGQGWVWCSSLLTTAQTLPVQLGDSPGLSVLHHYICYGIKGSPWSWPE